MSLLRCSLEVSEELKCFPNVSDTIPTLSVEIKTEKQKINLHANFKS